MIGPLLSPEAHVLLADNVPQQSATTAAAIAAVQAGQSTIWDAHAAAIAQANSRWGNVLQQLGGKHLSTGLHDILQAPLGQAGIRFEEHVLCSITNSPAEHEVAVRNFYDGMQPGDIAVRLFDVGSDGYYVSGISFPGLPLDAKQVSTQALRMGLDVLTAFEEPVESSLNDNTNAVGSTLRALGGAVLQMPLPTGAVS
ncbi:MAG TPA: hypothetical protein VLF40_03180 [Candidatus Saccharimonadales bacterium]|nr:hypothetical protein [Candidatus Saccharimonadales bacterium]